jgi:hypothetical protein
MKTLQQKIKQRLDKELKNLRLPGVTEDMTLDDVTKQITEHLYKVQMTVIAEHRKARAGV